MHVECIHSYFQLQDLNARLIMNAQNTLHVSVKNVKIRVKHILVVSTLNVWLEIIELSVFVFVGLLGIHSPFVKNVS